MSRQFFGTDGIRGKVGHTPITPDFMLRLGHAVGRVLKAQQARPTVVIGKDTRISGYMIESALEAGFNSAGVDVLLTGPLPTPGIAYLTRALRQDLGVVISASHNPFDDNGVKFFSAKGAKLPDAWELLVEAELAKPATWAPSAELGKTRRIEDAAGRYIEFCKSTFDAELSLKGLKLVIDAAHGAAYHIAPAVFHELGADIELIGCAPDGLNINAGVGATAPAALQQSVLQSGADYGLALDGDADRLQWVDASARLYNGDELLYALAADRLAQGEAVPGVVGTLMTNLGVEQAFQRKGIALVRAKVGDRYVLEELLQRNWCLGGESSGHLLATDRHTTGDGIISALQVLQAIQRMKKPLSAMLSDVHLFPQVMQSVKLAQGQKWQQGAHLTAAIEKAQNALGHDGRILIRPSGTEPVVRIMVECPEHDRAHALCEELVKAQGMDGKLNQ